MSGMLPSNISSAEVSASEIPDGFSLANSGAGGMSMSGDPASEQAKQRQAQREAILEQAMTPDALARLRRVKVSNNHFKSILNYAVNDYMRSKDFIK